MEEHYIIHIFIIGMGATLATDAWTLILKHIFHVSSLNHCLLGRWFLHMPTGTFKHTDIHDAPQKRFECMVGWIAHYVIGVIFAAAFILLAPTHWLEAPTFLPAFLFGTCTVVIPFCIMQPSFGLGFAASNTAKPTQARMKSLSTHMVFGIGLYLWRFSLARVSAMIAAAIPHWPYPQLSDHHHKE